MSGIRYRTARRDDLREIAAVHAESWRSVYRGVVSDEFLGPGLLDERLEAWRVRLDRDRPDQFLFVATENDRVVGLIFGYGAHDDQWGSLIDTLHLAPSHLRRGIGSELTRRAAQWLQSHHGDCGVYLWVVDRNQNAKRFYEALGGTTPGPEDLEVEPGRWEPCCRYVWPSADALMRCIKKQRGEA